MLPPYMVRYYCYMKCCHRKNKLFGFKVIPPLGIIIYTEFCNSDVSKHIQNKETTKYTSRGQVYIRAKFHSINGLTVYAGI